MEHFAMYPCMRYIVERLMSRGKSLLVWYKYQISVVCR